MALCKILLIFFMCLGFITSIIGVHEITHLIHYKVMIDDVKVNEICMLGYTSDADGLGVGWIETTVKQKDYMRFEKTKPELIAFLTQLTYGLLITGFILREGYK